MRADLKPAAWGAPRHRRVQPAAPPCASGSPSERVRLRAGPSARLAAVLAPAGVPTVPSVLPARLLGSAARGRAACRGGGTGTRTTGDQLTKGERLLMQMKLKIIWNL